MVRKYLDLASCHSGSSGFNSYHYKVSYAVVGIFAILKKQGHVTTMNVTIIPYSLRNDKDAH